MSTSRREHLSRQRDAGADLWKRYSAKQVFYFVYSHINQSMAESGEYGVVQLRCIEVAARKAFMAGLRAGKRRRK